MSQRRLIVSLALISSCLALVIGLAAWTFPLKAQGIGGGVRGGIAGGVPSGTAQGVSGGVAGGVSNGIAGGVSGGVSGGITTRASAEEPNVDISTIWTDTVKRGPMTVQVRGKGTLARGEGSTNFIARVSIPASISGDLKPGQNAAVESQSGAIGKGHVSRVGPVPSRTESAVRLDDARTVEIALDSVPQGTTSGLEIMASIEVGKLDNVLFVGRPVNTTANGETRLFKIANNGAEAVRTQVKVGRASVNTIEVLDGLQEGDKVILSDMSSVANAERIRLTDEKHLLSH